MKIDADAGGTVDWQGIHLLPHKPSKTLCFQGRVFEFHVLAEERRRGRRF